MTEREITRKSLYISKEAYMYLSKEQRLQRGCNWSEKVQQHREKAFNRNSVIIDGKIYIKILDYDMGGGDGTYNGKWVSWSIATIKKMLDIKKLHYIDGEDEKVIEIFI